MQLGFLDDEDRLAKLEKLGDLSSTCLLVVCLKNKVINKETEYHA